MDALALIPDKKIEDTDGYWIGALSWALTCSDPRIAKDTLRDFLRSSVPSPELRDALREEMKKR